MARKKVTRKQLLKEPDEFITLTSKTIQWCQQHPRQLTLAGCAILALIILIVGTTTYNDYRSRTASALLGQGMQGAKTLAEETDADLGTIRSDFDQLLSRYGSQPAGRMGRIIFAHMQLTKGSPDEAIDLYQEALGDFQKDPSLVNIIYNGLASAYEEKAAPAEAVGYYEKILEGQSMVLKDRALFHLGRLYDLAGDYEKSAAAFARLVTEFPNSMYTPMAKEA